MNSEKPDILIFGASGGIGKIVYDHFQKANYKVTGTYHQHSHNNLVYCDIRNYNEINNLVNQTQPRTILNFAALGQERICIDNPQLAFEVNVIGTNNLIEIASQNNISLLYPGTINEFSGYQNGTICTEETKPKGKEDSIYSDTKIKASEIIINKCTSPWGIFRTDIVLGKGFGIVELFKKNNFAQIRIDATRFPVYIHEYLKNIRSFVENPQKFSGITHLISQEFINGILLSDLAPIIIKKFNLASSCEKFYSTEVHPRVNLDDPMPIFIDPNAKRLATENRVFASVRR